MTDSPVYLGLDVAKLTLAVSLRDRSFELPNTPAGWRRLLRRILGAQTGVHVVCEASGGYERGVAAFLQQAQVPVSVLNAQRVRELARGCGQLAKTDKIDAALLARIGAMLTPAAQPPPENGRAELVELVARRDALVGLRKLEKQHAEHLTLAGTVRSQRRTLRFLDQEIARIEAALATHLCAHPNLAAKVRRLQQAPSLGPVSSVALIAALPELGQASRQQISALAGLAPLADDSGPRRGQRHIRGGRASARRILYLCALSAARYHPTLRTFYQRLRDNGKAPKLALTAVARKLLTYLNSALKNPHFVLAQ